MVNLSVNAHLSTGGFAKGLKQEEFHVLEDGVEQDIILFVQEAVPVHVALLIDVSGSVQSQWGSIRSAARRFAEALSPNDTLSIIAFNIQPRLILDWTQNVSLADKALGKLLPKGNTALFDAIYVAFDDLFGKIDGKKAVILLTDGFDNSSQVKYEEALDLAVRSNALIYVVSETAALRQTMEYYNRKEHTQINIDPMEFAVADNMLKHLTYQTGGRVLYPQSFGELANVYSEVAQELANQYAVGYIPHNRVKDGGYRNVTVTVERPDVRISTRPGYYAPKAGR
jgi:VWFA-related protein